MILVLPLEEYILSFHHSTKVGNLKLRDDLSTSVIADLIAGPLFYHLVVVAQVDQTLSNDPIEQLTRTILDGITPKSS